MKNNKNTEQGRASKVGDQLYLGVLSKMKNSILIVLAVFVSMSSRAEEDDYNESEIEACSFPVSEGLTIPKHLELKWKNRHTLPTSVTIKNPFQENIKLLTSPSTGSTGYPELDIECYDPDSKSWRSPTRLPSTFSGKYVTISYGQDKDFPLDDYFWRFVTHDLPEATSHKKVRIRLVYSFGNVHLRSEEFDWTLKVKNIKSKE